MLALVNTFSFWLVSLALYALAVFLPSTYYGELKLFRINRGYTELVMGALSVLDLAHNPTYFLMWIANLSWLLLWIFDFKKSTVFAPYLALFTLLACTAGLALSHHRPVMLDESGSHFAPLNYFSGAYVWCLALALPSLCVIVKNWTPKIQSVNNLLVVLTAVGAIPLIWDALSSLRHIENQDMDLSLEIENPAFRSTLEKVRRRELSGESAISALRTFATETGTFGINALDYFIFHSDREAIGWALQAGFDIDHLVPKKYERKLESSLWHFYYKKFGDDAYDDLFIDSYLPGWNKNNPQAWTKYDPQFQKIYERMLQKKNLSRFLERVEAPPDPVIILIAERFFPAGAVGATRMIANLNWIAKNRPQWLDVKYNDINRSRDRLGSPDFEAAILSKAENSMYKNETLDELKAALSELKKNL